MSQTKRINLVGPVSSALGPGEESKMPWAGEPHEVIIEARSEHRDKAAYPEGHSFVHHIQSSASANGVPFVYHVHLLGAEIPASRLTIDHSNDRLYLTEFEATDPPDTYPAFFEVYLPHGSFSASELSDNAALARNVLSQAVKVAVRNSDPAPPLEPYNGAQSTSNPKNTYTFNYDDRHSTFTVSAAAASTHSFQFHAPSAAANMQVLNAVRSGTSVLITTKERHNLSPNMIINVTLRSAINPGAVKTWSAKMLYAHESTVVPESNSITFKLVGGATEWTDVFAATDTDVRGTLTALCHNRNFALELGLTNHSTRTRGVVVVGAVDAGGVETYITQQPHNVSSTGTTKVVFRTLAGTTTETATQVDDYMFTTATSAPVFTHTTFTNPRVPVLAVPRNNGDTLDLMQYGQNRVDLTKRNRCVYVRCAIPRGADLGRIHGPVTGRKFLAKIDLTAGAENVTFASKATHGMGAGGRVTIPTPLRQVSDLLLELYDSQEQLYDLHGIDWNATLELRSISGSASQAGRCGAMVGYV